MNCEFCDKKSMHIPFETNDGWWHICPKCKSSWYKALLKRHNE